MNFYFRIVACSLALSLPLSLEVALAVNGEDLVEAFLSSGSRSDDLGVLVSSEVPVVGCPRDGQVGFIPAPKMRATIRVLLPRSAASELSFYTTSSEEPLHGVLGPRGWNCHGLYGSNGSTLYVVPEGSIWNPQTYGYQGPSIQRRFAHGDTSGRFEVAHLAGRIFPQARKFAEEVRAEGLDEPGEYGFEPWPDDQIQRLSQKVRGLSP